MGFQWILFDADGTLFDYERAEEAALDRLWDELGLRRHPDPLTIYRQVNAVLWKRFELGEVTTAEIKVERFRRLAGELELTADPELLSARYLAQLARQTQLLDGAERLLQSINGTRRMGLITNGLAEVQRPRLERSSIGHHFEFLVISEEVGSAKPARRIFERAHDQMGQPDKREVLMVGDNLIADIEGADRFGLATCWLNQHGLESSGDVRPTFEIHHLDQLAQLLEE